MPMSFDVGVQRCRFMAVAIGNMYISIFESCSCNKEILWNDMKYICSISTTIRILENESQDLRTPSQETGRSLGSSKRRLGWISLGRSTAPHRDKTAKLWVGKPCHQFGWLKNLLKHILGIVHPPYQLETTRFFVHPIHWCPIPPGAHPQPLSQAAEIAMPPLIHKVTGTSNVSMDAAHPSSTVAARSQVDTSTVSDRANWAKPPNNALTLKRQTWWVLLVVVVLFLGDYCDFPGNRHKRNKN